ncbi:hypothetical protein P153DRAFT_76303 [Dothidotthia symphoricarpi CBS 119687]|uniref:Uncharacterized protein n=1 Tax=Dothidotthia symphoricarpi CBS 119687 TaxID=1392245 RepID=A0A6A6A4A3_9PLEO|nr:uncharacterized protein P153DRAFT_76303 [Dothidotthia symphoricarpi CBS 119687]KAF2126376.1 hypothetical protein P153DRAFT_76303 [Dothidotthia symphoricarpi CBS 119687]
MRSRTDSVPCHTDDGLARPDLVFELRTLCDGWGFGERWDPVQIAVLGEEGGDVEVAGFGEDEKAMGWGLDDVVSCAVGEDIEEHVDEGIEEHVEEKQPPNVVRSWSSHNEPRRPIIKHTTSHPHTQTHSTHPPPPDHIENLDPKTHRHNTLRRLSTQRSTEEEQEHIHHHQPSPPHPTNQTRTVHFSPSHHIRTLDFETNAILHDTQEEARDNGLRVGVVGWEFGL